MANFGLFPAIPAGFRACLGYRPAFSWGQAPCTRSTAQGSGHGCLVWLWYLNRGLLRHLAGGLLDNLPRQLTGVARSFRPGDSDCHAAHSGTVNL